MIKVKIIELSSSNTKIRISDIINRLEEGLKDIDPKDIIAITQNKLIGYTIFYKDSKYSSETLEL